MVVPVAPVTGPDSAVMTRSGIALNVAVQRFARLMVTWPTLQSVSPLQPPKDDRAAGAAVSATTVFRR